MDEQSIIGNLESKRQEKGLTQNELAERIGIARNTYVNLVSGKTKVINEHLRPIADVLGIGLDELLLGYKPDKTPEALLKDVNDFEEQRLSLIRKYEDDLAAMRDKLNGKDETIADLRKIIRAQEEIISMQKRQLGE